VPRDARLTTPVRASARTQILSVLLDPLYPGFAENCIFVAGDRVTTDLLAQVIASDGL
jgi:hypothetical protein